MMPARPLVTYLTRRFSRRALPKPNAAYFLWRFVANGMRTCRSLVTPALHTDTRVIARELTDHGIVTGPSDRFLTEPGRRALAAASSRILDTARGEAVQAMVAGAASPSGHKDFVVDLASFPDGVPAESPLLKVALDEKLLEIVASYLGLWPSLYSIAAWLNHPVGAPASLSQLWHRDPEDLKIVKAFIYLVDVDEQCGPFTYIPGTHPFGAEVVKATKLERKKRFEDDRMHRVFPPEAWRVCTGPANTLILADTIGYHRGGRPTAGQRVLITFTYTSGTPIGERTIHVAGTPAWISAPIQRAALRPLLKAPRPAPKQQSKKKVPGTRVPA